MELIVEVDDDVHERLARRAAEQGLETPAEYSALILETVIDELETPETDDDVRNRLEDLGYL